MCQIAFGVILSPHTHPSRLTRLKIGTVLIPETVVQSPITLFVQGRDRNSPDMFSLADQVRDDPMSFRICRSFILRPTSSVRLLSGRYQANRLTTLNVISSDTGGNRPCSGLLFSVTGWGVKTRRMWMLGWVLAVDFSLLCLCFTHRS